MLGRRASAAAADKGFGEVPAHPPAKHAAGKILIGHGGALGPKTAHFPRLAPGTGLAAATPRPVMEP
jgi:hypothetical protein